MYKIEVTDNRNIIVNDIGIYVSSDHNNGILVDTQVFESSNDLKRLIHAGLLKASKADKQLNQELTQTSSNEKKDSEKVEVEESGALVRKGKTVENPEDVVIAQPKEETVKVSSNNKVSDEVKTSEDKVVETGSIEEKVIETKNSNATEEKTSTTKKRGRPKNTTNSKSIKKQK